MFRSFNDNLDDIRRKEEWVDETSKDPHYVFDFNLQLYLYNGWDVDILRDIVGKLEITFSKCNCLPGF